MNTSNFTAEYGRASGFIANAITRTGTNTLHGTLFEFFNHDRLNANPFDYNWQGVQRPPFRQNQFGASVGGPLRRDRLFFFGNFEQDRTSSQSQPLFVDLPTSTLIAALPASNPAKQLLTLFPPPDGVPIPGTGSLLAEETFVIPTLQRNNLAMGRTDYNFADGRQHLSERYAFSQQTTENFYFSVYPGLNAPLVNRGQNLAVNYTRDLSGGVNELKFGFNRDTLRLLRPHPELPAIFSGDGLLALNGVELPGMASTFDYSLRDSVFHVVDNYSKLIGNHALVLGAEWRLGLTDSLFSPFSGGEYGYAAGSDFFLNNQPAQLYQPINRLTGVPASANDFRRYYRQQEWAAFFQDNLKVTRRLVLNLGLRYEYFGVPAPRNGTQDSNFIFGQGQNIGERIASGGLQTGTLYQPDRNNFAPRFGFALDVTGQGKSVLRGGYGIYFDRIFDNIWLDVRNNNFPIQCIVPPTVVESNSGCNIPSTQSPISFAIPATQGLNPLNPASVQNTSTVALDSHLRTPYSQNWFIGFQQELTPNLVMEVNQVGSLGRRLITADGINRPDSLTPTSSNPHGRFNPSYGDIIYYAGEGHSNHVAIETSLNRRWSHGLEFQISYTYARTKDVQSDPLILPGSSAPGNPTSQLASSNLSFIPVFTHQFNPSADFGNSDFDQRHNLVMNFIAQAPRFSGWGRLLSGWQASGLVGIRSGFPFSVLACPSFVAGERGICNGANFTGTKLSQAFLANGPQVSGGVQLLDPNLFQAPPDDQIYNIKRNSLYGPGFWNADFAFSRTSNLPWAGERTQLQFRAEFFNLFNHTNLGNPDRFLGSSTFGQATFGRQGFTSALPSASPLNEQPRRIQFAVKIYF